ncbi:MAG: elongation factor P [Patescibacteria group bacterium]
MLNYNEIKERTYINFKDEPYEIISSHIFRKQQRKPVNNVKMKNLLNGKTIEHTFHQSDKIEEASIETEPVKFLFYKPQANEYWFCSPNDPKNRYSLPMEVVGESLKFIPENTNIEVVTFNEQPISLKIPIKISLEVTEAPPNIKGNTTQGGVKQVTLETGAVINTPMFINTGDKVVVNTDSGEYVERG